MVRRKCILKRCENSTGTPKNAVHMFPRSNPFLFRRWMTFVEAASFDSDEPGNADLEVKGLCSRHFTNDCYVTSKQDPENWKASQSMKLKENAFPTRITEKTTLDDINFHRNTVTFEHNYAKLPNYQEVYKTEVNALQWTIDESDKLIKEKNDIICSLRHQLSSLKEKLELAKLPKNEVSHEDFTLLQRVKEVLSPAQINALSHPEKNYVHWSPQEQAEAIALHSISSKCYNYLREKKNMPLPSETSIYRWLDRAEISPDNLLAPVFQIIEAMFNGSPDYVKQCGLAVDEMSIDDRFCYDIKRDRIYGKEKNVTVFTLRGLLAGWKQIIYFTFNSNITKELVYHIIKEVHRVGGNVRFFTCDMGPKNQRLWKDLGQGLGVVRAGVVQEHSFENPITGNRTYVFPDFPHLAKLFRNHVLDDGITFDNGAVLNKELFLELLRKQKEEFNLTYKLTHKHVYVKGQQRQRVAPAFQLFSSKVAEAIMFTNPGNETRKMQANKIKMMDKFFELFNTRVKLPGATAFTSPYGMYPAIQNPFLEEVYNDISLMRVGKRRRNSLAPFQKGLLMAIDSLRDLHSDLSQAPLYNDYIITSRLNQDLLENAFSRIRGFGAYNPNPTALDCIHRIRKLILSWNFHDSRNAPVQPSNESEQLEYSQIHPIFCCVKPTIQASSELTEEVIKKASRINLVVTPVVLREDDFGVESRCEEGGMEYVSGYVAAKFREQFPSLSVGGTGEKSKDFWVTKISSGGLTEPSSYWLGLFKKFEEFFQIYHPVASVNMSENVCANLRSLLTSKFPLVADEIINFYVTTRTQIRIKYLNRKKEDEFFKLQARKQASWRENKLGNVSQSKNESESAEQLEDEGTGEHAPSFGENANAECDEGSGISAETHQMLDELSEYFV